MSAPEHISGPLERVLADLPMLAAGPHVSTAVRRLQGAAVALRLAAWAADAETYAEFAADVELLAQAVAAEAP